MADERFASRRVNLSDPANDASAITPHDTNALSATTRAIYVGTTGNLSVKTAGGQTTVFKNVPAGLLLPVRATHVLTASTAADLVAMW